MAEPLRQEASHWEPHYLGYDGFDYIDACPREGWAVVPSWGLDGWDLGDWPLVTVAVRTGDGDGGWGLRIYTEGDLDTRWYESREALIAAIDEWAAWWWRNHSGSCPESLPASGPVPERFRGMFSWARLDEHQKAEAQREGNG